MTLVETAPGVWVACHDLGGDGPPVLVAHATGFLSAPYRPLVDALGESHRVIGVDLRGHGASPEPGDDRYEWGDLAADLLAVLDHLGIDTVLGLGHSCGAVALLLAEQRRPGTLRALYAYEPAMVALLRAAPDAPPVDNPMARLARRRRDRFASRDELRRYLEERALFAALDPRALDAYAAEGFVADGDDIVLACSTEAEARTFEGGTTHDALDHLGAVQCPVRLGYGAAPDSFSLDIARELERRLPRADVEVFAGLGHLGPLQDPATVGRAVQRFFAEVR